MPTGLQLDQPGEKFDKSTYQQAVGSIMYLLVGTRPDLAFAGRLLARYAATPTKTSWTAVKHLLRYVSGSQDLGNILGGADYTLAGSSYSSYGDHTPSGCSTGGYLFKLGKATISWSSKRQATVALSTTEAEYMAVTEAAKEAYWLQELLQDLGFPQGTTLILGDNAGAIKLAHNAEFTAAPSTSTSAIISFVKPWPTKRSSLLISTQTILLLTVTPKLCRQRSSSGASTRVRKACTSSLDIGDTPERAGGSAERDS